MSEEAKDFAKEQIQHLEEMAEEYRQERDRAQAIAATLAVLLLAAALALAAAIFT